MAKDRYLQALRGLAISAWCLSTVFLNVPRRSPFAHSSTFLLRCSCFYPVFLPTSANLMRGGLRRRISKVAGPYAFWSVIYLAAFPALHGRLGFWRSPWAPYRLRCTIYWSIHSLCCLLRYCSGSFHGIGSLSIV